MISIWKKTLAALTLSCVVGVIYAENMPGVPTSLPVLKLEMGPFSPAQDMPSQMLELAKRDQFSAIRHVGAAVQVATRHRSISVLKAQLSKTRHASSLVTGVAPPVLGCQDIAAGTVYRDIVPPFGFFNCYQFVLNEKSKIDGQLALPANSNGFVGLYAVDPVTGEWLNLDSAVGPASPLVVQTVNQGVRLVLAYQPTSGTTGVPFLFAAFNRPGFDQYEPNDKLTRPSVATMNVQVNGNIDAQGIDQDHYFFPLLGRQANGKIKVTFANTQTASIRVARRDQNNNYSYGPESPISPSQSGQFLTITNLPPSTNEFTYGLLARVAGNSTAAPNAQPYTLQVRSNDSYIADFREFNNENLTRQFPYPSGLLQTHSYLTLTTQIRRQGSLGEELVDGEEVEFILVEDNTPRQSAKKITSSGSAYMNFNFSNPQCFGTIPSDSSCSAFYSDFQGLWTGRAQNGAYLIGIANSTAQVTRNFLHVCREQYLGRNLPRDRLPHYSASFLISGANTQGSERVYLLGDSPELGAYNPTRAIPLTRQGSGPDATWTATVSLVPGSFSYRYFKRDGEGREVYESGYRPISRPDVCSAPVIFQDGAFRF